MASGDLISYSNFSNTYTSDLLLDNEGSTSKAGVYSAYVSSPSWYTRVTVNKSLNAGAVAIYISYWNGSTWVEVYQDTRSWGPFTTGEVNYQFYHNSTLGSTPKDVASAVLWEIYLEYPAPEKKHRTRLWTYTGGIGCMPEETYNNLYKGRPIYSCGGPVSSSVYSLAGGRSRDTALSLFSQSAARGTLITASNERKLVAYKYN